MADVHTRPGSKKRRDGWRNSSLILASAVFNFGLVALLVLADTDRRPLRRVGDELLYLEIEPRPRTPADRLATAAPLSSPRVRTAAATGPAETGRADRSGPDSPMITTTPDGSAIDDRWRVAGSAPRAALPAQSCDMPHRLSLDDRRRCDGRWDALGQDARVISGTGNADRDATFARHGARRLAAWENQRAAPARTATPCVELGPVVECGGVNIQVELFSTRDGILPNLRKRRE
ncbi:hypothetical protein [Brevundimonas sp.]|jgi:hypothetical protein|uniref:hypothetical protein n=1 Tax=Brevundimonas sp. TaxID=1871086 RepID=UPI0037BEBC73